MSVTTVIKAVIGNLEAVTSRTKPKHGVQLRETKIAVLPDPRFTKDSVGEAEGAGWQNRACNQIGARSFLRSIRAETAPRSNNGVLDLTSEKRLEFKPIKIRAKQVISSKRRNPNRFKRPSVSTCRLS
jgi:hypothetical protein